MSSTFWRFLKYARPYWPLILGAILFGVLKFTLALCLPGTLKYVTDYVLLTDLAPREKAHRLLGVLAVMTLAFLARAPVTFLRSYLSAKAGHHTIFDIRCVLYRHIQRLSLAYHHTRRTGATISRLINDLNAATGILNHGVIAVAMDLIFLHGVAIFLFVWDWRLASVSLCVLPLYGVVFHAINPRLRIVSKSVQEEMEEMSGEATEKLAGLQVVQSFVREKTEQLRFFQRHRRYYTKVLHRVRLRMTLTTTAEFLQAFGPIVVICYGGYRVIGGSLSLGDLLLFNGFLAHLYLPTRRLADYTAVLQEKLAAMDRVFEVLDEVPEIADTPDALTLRRPAGRITFEHVHFAYESSQPVLRDISLDVSPGQAVAFVGRSGAGKTTLVNLVPRFYDAVMGSVLVDGKDVRDLTVRSLRQQIGIVPQDCVLFSGTIRENILYGRRDASEDEVLEAGRMAHIDEFVNVLPAGYDTIIGERGLTLSGGQKQRLSIARAFLRDPRILILDEATSNLDSHAENIIQDALRELMRGRTTLVIAHRLSTVVNCDLVVVLEDGRLVQKGRHDSLVREKGPYRQLCRDQFGGIHLRTHAL